MILQEDEGDWTWWDHMKFEFTKAAVIAIATEAVRLGFEELRKIYALKEEE